MRFVLSVRHDGETLRTHVLNLRLPSTADAYLLLGAEVIAECTPSGRWDPIGDTDAPPADVDELAPATLIDMTPDEETGP